MKRLVVFLALTAIGSVSVISARAAEPTAVVRFREAYTYLTKADEARDSGDNKEAIELYRTALMDYVKLSKKYPEWQPGVVRFRITYCDNQLESLMRGMDQQIARSQPAGGDITKPAKAVTDDKRISVAVGPKVTMVGERQLNLEVIRSTAELCLKNGEVEKARSLLLEGMHLDPDSIAVRLLMALAQCQGGRHEDAMYIVEQVIEENPDNAMAHALLGTALFGLGRTDESRSELDIASKLDPGMAEAHYNLAQLFLWMSPPNEDKAETHYRKAVELGAARDTNLESRLPGATN